MKRVLLAALAVFIAVSAFAAPRTVGPSGDWRVVVTMPGIAYHTSMTIWWKDLTGTFSFEGDPLPMVTREDGLGNFSATFEVPAVNSPNGQAMTVVLRGVRTGDSIEGTAIYISDVPDPASCTGFVTTTGTFSATR